MHLLHHSPERSNSAHLRALAWASWCTWWPVTLLLPSSWVNNGATSGVGDRLKADPLSASPVFCPETLFADPVRKLLAGPFALVMNWTRSNSGVTLVCGVTLAAEAKSSGGCWCRGRKQLRSLDGWACWGLTSLALGVPLEPSLATTAWLAKTTSLPLGSSFFSSAWSSNGFSPLSSASFFILSWACFICLSPSSNSPKVAFLRLSIRRSS